MSFLLPFRCPGLAIDELSRKKLDLTAEELSEEKALAYSVPFLSAPTVSSSHVLRINRKPLQFLIMPLLDY